jgi:acetate---CoA ligase (ADP-forming) subunit beta
VLKREILGILDGARETGWVLEPDAKRMLSIAGVDVPRFAWAKSSDEAAAFARQIGYPVVAKVVSPRALHKTEVGGVVVGVGNEEKLREAFETLSRIDGFSGIVVDETLSGVELIVGAKNDAQFGPVILLGIGGVSVELYKDTAIRMAPLAERDVASMLRCLKARRLLEGFRGREPVSVELLTKLLMGFSDLVMAIADRIESIDLNPVICSSRRCAVADARIVLTPPTDPPPRAGRSRRE